MCFILVLTRANERYPLVVAANRDESRARPTTPPHRWPGEPPIIAGRDDQAGGTWLGVNAPGLLVAITNRRDELAEPPEGAEPQSIAADGEASPAPDGTGRTPNGEASRRPAANDEAGMFSGERGAPVEPPPPLRGRVGEGGEPAPTPTATRRRPADPTLPSRGGLCLGALHQPSLAAATAYASSELQRSRWNPFNLLCATADGARVTNWRGETWELAPGVHVVTNEGDPDDRALAMVSRGHELVARLDYRALDLDALVLALGEICRDTEGSFPICRPSGERGTVSSSIVALADGGSLAGYWHADGPPCQRPYARLDVSFR